MRMAIAVSTYHREVTTPLLEGAVEAFLHAGGDRRHLSVISCPGVWELPVAAATALDRLDPRPDAIITLGCVIKGETSHDRWINQAVCTTLAQFAAQHRIPVALGVLTCDTLDQAHARAGGAHGHKGVEAVAAAAAQVHASRSVHWGDTQ